MTADPHTNLALLAWQIELGADEAMLDEPVDCFTLPKRTPWRIGPGAQPATERPPPAGTAPAPAPQALPQVDPVAEARRAAGQARDLAGLEAAIAAFPHCDLKLGARNTVFADGNPAARVMVIGEAPGKEEDIRGKPFVGRAGQLLDRMFAAIGLSRDAELPESALYITNIVNWRPPQNRDPKPEEIAVMLPFVEAHVRLAAPDLLVLMGNSACQGVLGRRGITRLRGTWTEAFGLPVLPMFHPAFLLRNPAAKREAWADLLSLKARLGGGA
ncbi:uracil-DNA glycosylase [Rhodobacterales bacterium HKCCE2091]|nr:uracil-DNA glycosylase [Rhodobacterales bacterium HKCCE2091]